MNISIVSVFPEIYTNFLDTSLVRRAQESGLVSYNLDSFKSFVAPKERIDSPTFGPGSGMVIKAEVVQKAIEAKEKDFGPAFKVFFSPSGRKLDQDYLKEIANLVQTNKHLMLLPARYEGMDTRVEEQYADAIVSVGDFVLMGGDLPAMVFLEGFLRLIPGVVGKQESVDEESFSGPFVDYPCFGEPVDWQGNIVPEILRSGNHEQIRKWRLKSAVKKTVLNKFDWLRSKKIDSKEQKDLVREFIPAHYAVLMHCDVEVHVGPDCGQNGNRTGNLGKTCTCKICTGNNGNSCNGACDGENRVGNTSVTSIDIHDIARSAKSFGIKNYFVVTPLQDQQKIVQKMLGFWQDGPGFSYNKSRFESVKNVFLKDSLENVLAAIEEKEGKKPLIIVTSAKNYEKDNLITYYDQKKVWALDRPVLFVFGTGQGLSERVMQMADFILVPVEGFFDYNHLSVRSAAAIIFDRWLGSNIKDVK